MKIVKGRTQLLGVAGGLMLVIGCFSPVMSTPMGSITMMFAGNTLGRVLLIIAIVSLVLTVLGQYRYLLVTGLASLGVTGYELYQFQTQIGQLKTGGVASAVAQTLAQSVQFSWGWVPLFLGALLIMLSGALGYRR
ncbi:hypothetical protein [Methanosphaerula subterraneus]|uniref:hypothetical protein n=1 Tax=Methanosphaerula subterraneus TaxID=3350244 RepID=UPI003F845F8E